MLDTGATSARLARCGAPQLRLNGRWRCPGSGAEDIDHGVPFPGCESAPSSVDSRMCRFDGAREGIAIMLYSDAELDERLRKPTGGVGDPGAAGRACRAVCLLYTSDAADE